MAFRPAILGLSRAVFTLGVASAAPIHVLDELHDGNEEEGTELWVLFVASIFLVLLGGAFAGLTIALMGQDSVYLQVISQDPTEPQQKNAGRVLRLLEKGKHWVLVTLLLSNVIVNEVRPSRPPVLPFPCSFGLDIYEKTPVLTVSDRPCLLFWTGVLVEEWLLSSVLLS